MANPADPGTRDMAIDIERLLAPISAEAPAGEPLRYEGTYDRIREARREDDPSLPQGVWVSRLKTADFQAVAALCAEALERRSKDLQLAAWLAEAWVPLHGAGGVAPGLSLAAALCDRYWEGLFPELGDEGPEPRASLIAWLDEAVARRLRLLPLADAGEDRPPFTLIDWEAGHRPPVTEDARWAALREAAAGGLAAAEALERSLAARMQRPPVPHRTRAALRSLEALVTAMIGEPQPGEAPAAGGALADPGVAFFNVGRDSAFAVPAAPAPQSPGATIRSRAEAYRVLAEAADYLLRTEPHSPVPYLVKRAISWGNMSLAELLSEFVASSDDLVTIYRLLGIRGREEG